MALILKDTLTPELQKQTNEKLAVAKFESVQGEIYYLTSWQDNAPFGFVVSENRFRTIAYSELESPTIYRDHYFKPCSMNNLIYKMRVDGLLSVGYEILFGEMPTDETTEVPKPTDTITQPEEEQKAEPVELTYNELAALKTESKQSELTTEDIRLMEQWEQDREEARWELERDSENEFDFCR